jgi:hypothetical protein
MNVNVGGTERIVRVAVGIALLSAIFFVEGQARWFGLIGIVPILTGITGFCPAYLPFGINTCKTARKP